VRDAHSSCSLARPLLGGFGLSETFLLPCPFAQLAMRVQIAQFRVGLHFDICGFWTFEHHLVAGLLLVFDCLQLALGRRALDHLDGVRAGTSANHHLLIVRFLSLAAF
jgi:hypothetical protein